MYILMYLWLIFAKILALGETQLCWLPGVRRPWRRSLKLAHDASSLLRPDYHNPLELAPETGFQNLDMGNNQLDVLLTVFPPNGQCNTQEIMIPSLHVSDVCRKSRDMRGPNESVQT